MQYSNVLIIIFKRADCESESNLTRSTCNLSNNQRIGVYSGIIGSLIIFGVLRVVLFILLMLNSSTAVHNKMFSKILRSPILFFDTNPIGQYIIQLTVQHVYMYRSCVK